MPYMTVNTVPGGVRTPQKIVPFPAPLHRTEPPNRWYIPVPLSDTPQT